MFYKIVESISKLFTKSISIESETDSIELTVPEERTLLIDSNIVSGNLLKFNDLSITNDIYVGHNAYVSGTTTTGQGYVSGGLTVGNYIQMLPVGNIDISTNKTASYIYTSGSTNDLYFTQYGSGIDNTIRLRWLESLLTTGILHGGRLSTVNGTTTFSITDGSGLIVKYNADTDVEPYPSVNYVNWNNYVSQSLIYSGSAQITYVAIDNSGSIIQSPTQFGLRDYDDKIILGRILHQTGSISNGTITSPRTAYGVSKKSSDFIKAVGPLKISGHVMAASGSTLGLIKSTGTSFVEGRNYTSNADDPNLVLPAEDAAIVDSKIYREHISGSTVIIDTGIGNAGYPVINPTKYNNNGTLATVTANKWTLQRVYWFPRAVNRALFVYYGNAIYNNIKEATDAILTETFVEGDNTSGAAIFIGIIIVRGGASNLADTGDAKIIQAGIFSTGGVATGGGGSATIPGDGDKSIQFNDGGSVFGGSANFTFDNTTNVMTLTGSISGTTGLFTTITGSIITGSTGLFTSITGSHSGSGAGLYNITASGISNFTNDVRSQFSQGTNITIVGGVISSTAGGSGSPGGTNTTIQFNSGSTFSGSTNLIYDYATNIISGTTAQFTTITSSVILATGDIGIGIATPDNELHVHRATAGAVTSIANAVATIENNTSAFLQVLTPATSEGGMLFGSPTSNVQGGIVYNHSTDVLTLRTGGNSARLNIDVTGNVAIGKGAISGTSRFNVGASDQFQVNSTGNIVAINNVITSFPASQGAALTCLRNNGSGVLTWSPLATVTNATTATPATFDASLYQRATWIASFPAPITAQISNLTDGREIFLYARNTNAAARVLTITASTTAAGFAAVNFARSGAASVTTISLALTSGTATIWVANIGGNIVGAIY